MTRKEIDRAKKTLPKWKNGIPPKYTPEQEKLSTELSCRNMINSCLAYSDRFFNSGYDEEYNRKLGKARVKELYDEQKSDFEKATLCRGVYTDNEGVTYNAIKWADEE